MQVLLVLQEGQGGHYMLAVEVDNLVAGEDNQQLLAVQGEKQRQLVVLHLNMNETWLQIMFFTERANVLPRQHLGQTIKKVLVKHHQKQKVELYFLITELLLSTHFLFIRAQNCNSLVANATQN